MDPYHQIEFWGTPIIDYIFISIGVVKLNFLDVVSCYIGVNCTHYTGHHAEKSWNSRRVQGLSDLPNWKYSAFSIFTHLKNATEIAEFWSNSGIWRTALVITEKMWSRLMVT